MTWEELEDCGVSINAELCIPNNFVFRYQTTHYRPLCFFLNSWLSFYCDCELVYMSFYFGLLLLESCNRPVGLKIEIHEIHEIHQNFTKSSVYIN